MLISLKYIAIILKLTGAYLNKTYVRTRPKDTEGRTKERKEDEEAPRTSM